MSSKLCMVISEAKLDKNVCTLAASSCRYAGYDQFTCQVFFSAMISIFLYLCVREIYQGSMYPWES